MLRPGGRLALMVFTREDVAAQWLTRLLPVARGRGWSRRTRRSRS